MSIEEDFKKAFDQTTEALVEGKTGAGVVTELAPETPAAPVVAPVTPEPAVPAAVVVAPVVPEPSTPAAVVTPDPAKPETPATVVTPAPVSAVADKLVDGTPAVVAPAPVAPAPVAPDITPAVTPAPAPTPASSAEAKRIADLEAEIRQLKESPKPAPVAIPDPAPSPAPVAAAPEPEKPFEYTPEQKTLVDDFEKEWPDVAAYQKLQKQVLQHEIVTGVKALFTDFTNKLQEGLAPVVNAHLQSGEERHFAEIHVAHKDFDQIVDLVPAWIDGQPPYLQEPMKQVYAKGSSKDIIDLVSRFKKETGRVQPESPNPTPSVTPASAVVAPAKEKVAALTVVPAQRTSPKTDQPPAPDDFATAFNKTVAELTAVAK